MASAKDNINCILYELSFKLYTYNNNYYDSEHNVVLHECNLLNK